MVKKLSLSHKKATKQSQTEISIKNTIDEMRDKLYRLQYVTTALSKEPTIKEIATIIVTLAAASMSADGGTIWLYSGEEELQLAAQVGYTEEEVNMLINSIGNDDTPTGDAVRLKKPIMIHSRKEREKLYPHTVSLSESRESESFIAIPLLAGKEVLGVVGFSFRAKKEFNPEEMEYVYTLTQQCAQAIEKAKYFEEDQIQNKKLKTTVARLTILQDITEHLSHARSVKDTSDVIVSEGAEGIGAKAGEIVLLSDDRRSFYIPTYYGFPHWYMKNIANKSMPLNFESPLYILDVAKSGEPVFIPSWKDVSKEYTNFFEIMKIIQCRAAVYLPLIIEGKVIGVMDFSFADEKIFEQSEKEFMMTLAENCAQALDRAFGYQKIKDYADEIEKREAKFRALIENSSDAIVLLDKNGKFLYRSPSSQKITLEDPSQRLGSSFMNVVYEEDKEKVKKWLYDVIKGKQDGPRTTIFRRILTNGGTPWLEATAENLLDDPSLNAIVINARNVTDQVEATMNLKKSQEELQTILENIIDAVLVYDGNGKILYANAAAVKLNKYQSLKGLMEDSSFGKHMEKFLLVTDESGKSLVPENLWNIMQEKKIVTEIRKYIFKEDGEEQWRKVTTALIVDGNGKIDLIVSISQDITEEKEKERLKDEFISTASHELKTPITSASLYTGILQKHLQETGDQKGFATLNKVDSQLRRLTKLINDLLDVSRINTGGIYMKKQNVIIDALIAEVVEEMQYTTITHKLIIKGESKRKVFVDKERIREVLVNLISNAIKYSPASKKVEVLVENKKKEVKICVRDYGVGIRTENQEKIFEPFYRESHKSGARFPGLGLGLHISSKIITMHGGKLWVDSIYGKGSEFCILLPIAQV